MPNQVVWFDLPVVDLDRAIRFYSAVLGEAVTKQSFSPGQEIGVFAHSGGEVGGCLVKTEKKPIGDAGPVLYLNCGGRLDAAIAEVEKSGGKILQPKHSIGPHGFVAVILDSEGNRVSLHSM